MGASASHSSPNLPSSYTLAKTEKATRLFTVTDYSKWAPQRAGSVVEFDMFSHNGRRYSLKVYPAGLDDESAGFVAVFLVSVDTSWFHDDVRVFIEILDAGRERAIFDHHTASAEQTLLDHRRSKGYARFVARSDLDESPCVRDDDTFTIRCTLSVKVEVTKLLTSPRAPP